MIGNHLSADELSRARHALSSPLGPALLDFLRTVSYGRSLSGRTLEMTSIAESLGWIESGSEEKPKLTNHGRWIADSAREYSNWLQDGQDFPVDIIPKPLTGKRVLDVGCGFGRYLLTLSRYGARGIGVEAQCSYVQLSALFANMAECEPPEITLARAEYLPFPAESFDVALCFRAINYMQINSAFSEIARVVKPGGFFILAAGTLGLFLRACVETTSKLRKPAYLKRKTLEFLNTVTFQLSSRRIYQGKNLTTTARPVYPTLNFLLGRLLSVGFKPVNVQPRLQQDVRWIVCQRL